MKTLIIHPKDPSTAFVKEMYKDFDWTVIDDPRVSKKKLKKEIQAHDRIFMIGHGTPHGLLTSERTIIDSNMVYLLREKECIFFWCDADKFVEKYDLKGFYTGMIISEQVEADFYQVWANQEEINESNDLMMRAVKESVDSGDMLKNLKEIYNSEVNPKNDVIGFNEVRFYHSDSKPDNKPENYSVGAMGAFLLERVNEDPKMITAILKEIGLPFSLMSYDRYFKIKPQKEKQLV